jgi:hypothetical protein
MSKLLISAAALITLLVVSDTAFAAGASRFAPGRQVIHGKHGASAHAPGHLFLSKGPISGHPGASGYAPGRHAH